MADHPTRRHFLKSATLASIAALMPACRTSAPPPNFVLILADDLGWGDLSSYGATDLHTPHIDALVSRGMKFTNF